MILYYKEYKEKFKSQALKIGRFQKCPQYIHESIEAVLQDFKDSGVVPTYTISALKHYFKWLALNYEIDTSEAMYKLTLQKKQSSKNFFFSLDELKQTIAEAVRKAEYISDTSYECLVAVFYLQWYGVKLKDILSIQLSDISDDGKRIFVPDENRTIIIDDGYVATYMAELKQSKGFVVHKKRKENQVKNFYFYKQETLYRTKNSHPISMKTIYHAQQKFIVACGDKRLSKRVYYSGLYNRIEQSTKGKDIVINLSKESKKFLESLEPCLGEISPEQLRHIVSEYNEYISSKG